MINLEAAFLVFQVDLLAVKHYASPRTNKHFTLDMVLMHALTESLMQPFLPSVPSARGTHRLDFDFGGGGGCFFFNIFLIFI